MKLTKSRTQNYHLKWKLDVNAIYISKTNLHNLRKKMKEKKWGNHNAVKQAGFWACIFVHHMRCLIFHLNFIQLFTRDKLFFQINFIYFAATASFE